MPEKKSPRPEAVIKILAVDDEPDILRFLQKCFAREGYEVLTSENPVLAMTLLNSQNFDVVLSDVKMAGMDGLALLKHIKENHPATEVLLMTGYATVEAAVRSMKLGAFDFLTKPFHVNELLTTVRRAIQHHENANDPNRFRDWDKMKEEFLRNTSHELRTPMSSVKTASYMLLKEFHEKGDVLSGKTPVKMLSIIDRNADRMIRLIDDLLDVFRFQSKKVQLSRVPISIQKMVMECVEDFTAPCQERGLTLVSDLEDGLPVVRVDPVKLRQSLLNLFGNAMKFTSAGGKITLGARKCTSIGGASGVEIFVKDTGVGIPPDQQDKIFEKFYQVDGSTSRGKPGLGLGLALTKAIVNAHGGTIAIDSMPGFGSTFSIRLPASSASSACNSADQSTGEPVPSTDEADEADEAKQRNVHV